MKNALIVSLNFRVAHVAHLVASYRQMEEIGYCSCLFINPNLVPYIPKDIRYITDLKELKVVDLAIFWFPAMHNLSVMMKLKIKYHSKILYVFHEPIEKYQTYKKLGFTYGDIFKVYCKYAYTLSFLFLADAIVLPSKKAEQLYVNSLSSRINSNYYYIPLLFPDENKHNVEKRMYFSYIGTIAQDHAFDEYCNCIIKMSDNKALPEDVKFLIATRNIVKKNKAINELIASEKLRIIEGKPLTDEEINECYSRSLAVWNVYNRTTQSGVLAKASMFGTPALVKSDNLSEFSIDGYNVKAVQSNTDISELSKGILNIIENIDRYSKNSRQMFESTFYYRIHNDKMASIIENL